MVVILMMGGRNMEDKQVMRPPNVELLIVEIDIIREVFLFVFIGFFFCTRDLLSLSLVPWSMLYEGWIESWWGKSSINHYWILNVQKSKRISALRECKFWIRLLGLEVSNSVEEDGCFDVFNGSLWMDFGCLKYYVRIWNKSTSPSEV